MATITASESFQKIDQSFLNKLVLAGTWGVRERLAVVFFDAALGLLDDFFAGVFLSAIEFAIGQLILQDYALNSAILTPVKLTVT